MIEALGGQAYLQVEDWKCKGKYADFQQGKSLGDISYYRFWKWPAKERFQYAKLSDEIFIYTQDAVYEATFSGQSNLTPAGIQTGSSRCNAGNMVWSVFLESGWINPAPHLRMKATSSPGITS